MESKQIWTFVIGAVIGAVVGWVFRLLAAEFGWDAKMTKRLRQLRRNMAINSPTRLLQSLQFGNLSITDWHILDGFFKEGYQFKTKVDKEEVELPEELGTLRTAKRNEIEQKRLGGDNSVFNGECYAVKSVSFGRTDLDESNICSMRLCHSDYSTVVAVMGSLDEKLPGLEATVRNMYFKEFNPLGPKHQFLMPTFGVNLAVITKDDLLLVVKRSDTVRFFPGAFNSSMNESVRRPDDLQKGTGIVDPLATAKRGMKEELEIEADEISECKITSVGYTAEHCQFGFLGHALLRLTWDEWSRKFALAKDGAYEIGRGAGINARAYSVFPVEHTPKAFEQFMREQIVGKHKFTSHGLSCFLLSFLATGSSISELNSVFEDDFWRNRELTC